MKNDLVFEENPFFLIDENIPIIEDQVFVILPFKNTIIFEKIVKPVLSNLDLKCIKADDIFKTGTLMQVIANSIRESAIIVADLTDKNANVFYELGLAHAFKKRVILLTQNDEDVPSDLKSNKYYKYNITTSDGIINFEECLRKLKEGIDLSLTFEHNEKIYDISSDYGNEEQINSDFLKQEEGTLLIWAYLNESHVNPTKSDIEWTYVISHATNNGNRQKIVILDSEKKEKEFDIYPNIWAIGRGANKDEVFWRFIYNNGIREIHLNSKAKLDPGWHMFGAIWSKDKNFIKFYINDKIEGKADFDFWPSNFAKHVFIGTWPNRAKGHYLNSKIGNWIIYKNAVSYEKIRAYFLNNKPDKKE